MDNNIGLFTIKQMLIVYIVIKGDYKDLMFFVCLSVRVLII